ncbi:MAG: EamA family transporter [Oscillospiraceae bacterium]|nr:EamA family transporter [Oscillospiraceae bacterium]
MTDYKPNPVRGVLCTLIGGCCWGFSGNCGQYLFNVHGVDPQWLTVVRMITAGLITVGIVAARDKQKLIDCAKNKHDRIMMLLYGVFGLLLSQYTYLEAINATNAGTATVLQYIGPVLVMVLVCFSGRRLPKAHEALSIVLVIVGTFLLATHGNPNTVVINPAGLFWGLFAACTLVLYTLLPKSIAPKYGAFMTTGLGTLIGGIAFFIIVHPWPLTVDLPLSGWLAVAGMIIVGTVIAYPLYVQGVNDVGPVKASMLASVEPVSAAVISAVWLKSEFAMMDIVGFVCIITTVFLLAKPEKSAE